MQYRRRIAEGERTGRHLLRQRYGGVRQVEVRKIRARNLARLTAVLEVVCFGSCWGNHCNYEQNCRDYRKTEVTRHGSPPPIPLELYCSSSGCVQYYF